MEEFRKKNMRNGRVISGTWKDKKNHTLYAECLGKELGYTKQDDWYKLSLHNLKKSKKIFSVRFFFSLRDQNKNRNKKINKIK